MSQNKKVIHELPLEELFKIATESSEAVVMDKLSEAAKFIYDIGIKHGDAKIPAQVIYFEYKNWKGWSNKKQAKAAFFKDFAKYFDSHRTKDGITYLLDPKPFDLSPEAYWRMRSELRRGKTKKTQK